MELYQTVLEVLSELPELRNWPEMIDLAQRAAAHQSPDWKLPVIACQAVGGEPAQALPAVAAIACAQCSIILVDDLLDQDPRGEYHRLGAAAAANLAIAFQAAGLQALARSAAQPEARLAALSSLNQMLLATAWGQYLDSRNPADELAYWQLVSAKSSPFFAAALQIGALLGGAAPATASDLWQIGAMYGEIIQLHDDLGDTMATPASPDWLQGRSPLPVLFARLVDHPQRQRFLELQPRVEDPSSLAEAQMILVRCGAVSYCIDQIVARSQQASAHLDALALTDPASLQALLDDLVRPVEELFQSLDCAMPD